MITIYLNGCSTCGVNSVFVRRVQSYGRRNSIDVDVKNSRYDEGVRAEHVKALLYSGLPTGEYAPIVVEDGLVTKLREWNK